MRPLVHGLHLGLLQTGLLLALQRATSAAAETYAAVLGGWLLGAASGLWLGAAPRALVLLGVVAHLVAHLALAGVDFSARSPALWLPAIIAVGLYSGRYFTAAIAAGEAPARVFAGETYGFLVGAVLALVAAVVGGRWALVLAPVISAAPVLALGPASPPDRRGPKPNVP
ncbi:MAG: hypothetical protein R3B09_26015 [Nannocystaceae bacterium]